MDDETRKKMNVEETFAAIDKIIGRLERETDPWKKLLRTMKKV